MSNRLSQMLDLLEEARENDDLDKVKEIESDMFREFGYDAETGKTYKSAGGPIKNIPAMMDATSNRATRGAISRGGRLAVRGTKFRGLK